MRQGYAHLVKSPSEAEIPAGIRESGVFFAIHERPYGRAHYASWCLVDGLNALGVPTFSNCDIPGARVAGFDPMAHELYIFNITERTMEGPTLPFVRDFPRRGKILLSMSDTNSIICAPDSVVSLMTHENKFYKMTGDRRPWAFGISSEILEKTKNPPSFKNRRSIALRNFRPSTNQDVRNYLDLSFVEALEKRMPIDREISDDHFQRLTEYSVCLAYGGAVLVDRSKNPYFANNPEYQTLSKTREFLQPLVIVRWDSWRFWESLAAGCLTLHLDFEKYGFLLPEMPVPWKHYIPIDMADPVGSVEKLMECKPRWEEIACTGRDWAIAHYGPEAVARRLLSTYASLPR
jgi:hypothetical protein